MALPIREYALLGDCHTAALVGSDGSIDWLCLPRFDSGACFAALLGTPDHGRWRIAPVGDVSRVRRRYRDGTLVLETDFETATGAVRITDAMPLADGRRDVVRIVEGLRGRVPMHLELIVRFDYGSIVPWVRRVGDALRITAGPDTLDFHAGVPVHGEDLKTVGDFDVRRGQRISFVLHHRLSHEPEQPPLDVEKAVRATERGWRKWSERSTYRGKWRAAVLRSLITLKALSYRPTGGIVAAPTTSLPEQPGGVRNWDYRFCWLRDATFTLNALLLAGFTAEAVAWREWLLRAVAGDPADLQILYSVTGERRLDEVELDWLPGYGGAAPVRIGNAASRQFQLDVYGELMDTLHVARAAGLDHEQHAWRLQRAMLEFLVGHWHEPDEGIWEMRGPRRQFTHSKVMAWVAFDRAIRAVEDFGLDGPADLWRRTRDEIHAQVCELGFDRRRNAFVQSYGDSRLDASLLLIPLVGFLPASDPRVRGTIDAIQKGLMAGGLVHRYSTSPDVDRLPPGEATFLPCSFWLAGSLALIGRRHEAVALFERLLDLRNDVGLMSEEAAAGDGRMFGNFPQALTHVALVNAAHLLTLSERQIEALTRGGERPAAVKHTSNTRPRRSARAAAGM